MSTWTGEQDFGFGATVNAPITSRLTSPLILTFGYPYIQIVGTETGASPSWIFQEYLANTAWAVNATWAWQTGQWTEVSNVESAYALQLTAAGVWQFLQSGPTAGNITWNEVFTIDPSGNTTQMGNADISGNLTVDGTLTAAGGFSGSTFVDATFVSPAIYTLAANLPQLYVSPGGHDSNNGLSAGTPFLTIQKAVNVALTYDLGGNPSGTGITINLAPGTYTAGCVITGAPRGAANGLNNIGAHISIVGAGVGTTTITDSSQAATIIALNGAVVTVSGVTLTSTAGSLLFPSYGAVIGVGQITCGSSVNGHFHAETDGTVYVTGTSGYTISGGATAHWEVVLGGRIVLSEAAKTVTITGSPVFTNAFAYVTEGSLIYCPNAFVAFSGAPGATTYRYHVDSNSVIETNNGGPTYLPGTALGYMLNGGRYMPIPTPSLSGTTGFGSGSSAVLVANSTDKTGAIQVTLGSGPGSSGTILFNFGGGGTLPHGIVPNFTLLSGTGSLQQQAQTFNGGMSGNQMTIGISNNGVTFPSGTFFVQYRFESF